MDKISQQYIERNKLNRGERTKYDRFVDPNGNVGAQRRPVMYIPGFTLRGYKRMYLPLCEVADTSFHIQGDD